MLKYINQRQVRFYMILYRNCNSIPIFGENLLINPDFSINQRGLTEYKGHSVYCVDRWAYMECDC